MCVVVHHLELVAFAHRPLVDVAAEDQFGTAVDEAREHVVASRDRLLSRAPRCADQLVVKSDDAQRTVGRLREARCDAGELRVPTPPDWCRQGRTEFTPTT